MAILITGAAGFIGFHLSSYLLKKGIHVIGYDNINDYYDTNLKESRLEELRKISAKNSAPFSFEKGSIEDNKKVNSLFEKHHPQQVVNLAAQAGVRYSIQNPSSYIQSNLVGFGNILEACRHFNVRHLIYASSSSVYGGNKNLPFSEKQGVDHPVSLYAATKKANELMAHTYSHLYGLPATGLRFFTVYGPWGRPDMALFLFTEAILKGEPIDVYNNGNMSRDFTYVDDVVESLARVIKKPPSENKSFNFQSPDPSSSWAPHRIFNIGNSNPTSLMKYIAAIENTLQRKAIKNFKPIQPGDVPSTEADVSKLESWVGFKPSTTIEAGVSNFVSWYRAFYGI